MSSRDVEVLVTVEDGRQVLGVLTEWEQRDGVWVGHVIVYDHGSQHRDVVSADRLEQLLYCPWYCGALICQHACERQDGTRFVR